mmetsp:Transcript_25326/g.45659  ORF Transcript_25326/g.45659 Transcript_25326/m.45659 type:complete len:259 (+) Transcript_25326:490-1266(+)
MRPIHIGIRHNHNLPIPQRLFFELGTLHPQPTRRNQSLKLVVLVNPLGRGTFDVQYLSSQRQYRLGASIAALLGTSRGGITLHDKQFRFRKFPGGTVGQFAREDGRLQQRLLAYHLTRRLGGRCGSLCRSGILEHDIQDLGMKVEEFVQFGAQGGLYSRPDLRVAQPSLGLSFKLWIGHADADDGGESLAHVVSAEVAISVLEFSGSPCRLVQCSGEAGFESLHVRSTVAGANVVDKRQDVFVVTVGGVAEGHVDGNG